MWKRSCIGVALIAAVTSLAALGCTKKDEQAKPTAITIASTEDYKAKGIDVMRNKVIPLFEKDGTKCDQLADDLNKLMTETEGLHNAMKDFEKAHPDAQKNLENDK